jgi:hypothetical protein
MMGWFGHPNNFFFGFFVLDFFVIGAFWEKNVKVVKLPQFEWIIQEGKVLHLKLWR